MEPGDTYLAWDLAVSSEVREVIVAELADLGFEGFEEFDHGLTATLRQSAFTGDVSDRLDAIAIRHAVAIGAPRRIEPQNWNARWEATVRPIEAGPFVVHPPWHDPPPGRIPLRIEPKMSFGTGHHETTRLMLELLPGLVRPGDGVLDAGTGTGVLAIAAVLLGAARAAAFDTDPWAVRNARENAASNGVGERVIVHEGRLAAVPTTSFDVVLANINRTVLMELIPGFRDRIEPGGRIAIAGVLSGDREAMLDALTASGFEPTGEAVEGDWWAGTARLA